MIRCKPFFANDCERTEVWSAFCERSYGGIGESCVENMGSIIRQGSVRSTKKNADEQENPFFLVYVRKFLYLCALFYDDMIIVAQ